MGNLITWVVTFVAIGYFGIAALLYIGQRNLLFLPTPENNFVSQESIRWQSGAETIKVWRIGTGMSALVYFGGNAEDVAGNIPDFKHYFPDHKLYLVNYRGYGGSTGKPTESGLFEDALNVYDKISENHQNISVMGRSLGSIVAVQLAAERDVNKLIVVTPFDSVINMAKGLYPIFPVSLLLKDQLDAVGRINAVQAPILVLVAEQDGIIPGKRTDAFINAIPTDQVSVRVIADATHNDIQNSAHYADALISFIGDGAE